MARLLSTILWSLLLVFLPTWLGNLAHGAGTHLEWNPLAIAMAWPTSLSALHDYSASFSIGAVATLILCLWWYVRQPSVFYGLLLFCGLHGLALLSGGRALLALLSGGSAGSWAMKRAMQMAAEEVNRR